MAFPSAEWTTCEAQNYARTLEAPIEQLTNPVFMQRWTEQNTTNQLSLTTRALGDPSWLGLPSGNTPVTPLCATWSEPCSGDPFRYAEASGPDGAPFYTDEADVTPFVIYDQDCARLSGRVWAPKGSRAGSNLPNVVIENGSVQASEPLYWWFAQDLVRAGYVVLTFDPRGQGRSDLQTPTGQQGGNFNSAVFWEGLVNVIDFFRSNPVAPYPHNTTCAGTYPTAVTAFNPFHDRIDRNRLGIAGHSLGATGVSVVQSYGAPGADAWPGLMDANNPVKVAVAWDGLSAGGGGAAGSTPAIVPRVPAMGHTSEYGLTPVPFAMPPDAEEHKAAYAAWVAADLPVYEITVRGSTHYEWSQIPGFPTTSWCPDTSSGACRNGWGIGLAQHYSLAWMDRWLKQPGEAGYATADARLLDDGNVKGVDKMSFRFHSARRFPTRSGRLQHCEDIRAGCP